MEPTLDLSDLVFTVRNELEAADLRLRNAEKPTLFRLASMELELNFVVKSSDEVKGGFDLKIISLGSKLADANEKVQKIKIKFEVPPEVKRSELPGSRFFGQGKEHASEAGPITPLE